MLSSVVQRLLSKFIRRADDGDSSSASSLRASLNWQKGGVVLRNLELNLDSLLADSPFIVSRAYAMRLQLDVPWTNLWGAPIQVCAKSRESSSRDRDSVAFSSSERRDLFLPLQASLDTVTVVLEQQGRSPFPAGSAASSIDLEDMSGPGGNGGGPWWLSWTGSYLQSQLRRILGNVELGIRNLVVKVVTAGGVITLTCQSIRLAAPGPAIQMVMHLLGICDVPFHCFHCLGRLTPSPVSRLLHQATSDDWLLKSLEVASLAVTVEPPSGASSASPLLRVPRISTSCRLPFPASLFGGGSTGETTGAAAPAAGAASMPHTGGSE